MGFAVVFWITEMRPACPERHCVGNQSYEQDKLVNWHFGTLAEGDCKLDIITSLAVDFGNLSVVVWIGRQLGYDFLEGTFYPAC